MTSSVPVPPECLRDQGRVLTDRGGFLSSKGSVSSVGAESGPAGRDRSREGSPVTRKRTVTQEGSGSPLLVLGVLVRSLR